MTIIDIKAEIKGHSTASVALVRRMSVTASLAGKAAAGTVDKKPSRIDQKKIKIVI